MAALVLVAHATRSDAIEDAAAAVAAVLREHGAAVEIREARSLPELDAYIAVIVGAPVRRGHWHRDARRMLEQHRGALAGLPVAAFEIGARGTEAQLERDLARVPEVAPVAIGAFAEQDREPLEAWARDIAGLVAP